MLNNLKKFGFCLIACSLLTGCGDQSSSSRKIILGTSADNRPYEFFSSEHNKITGFDIELAELIAVELKAELEIKDMDFNALIPAVSTGRIDMAMASITPTNERKKSVDFSDIYYEAKAAMLVREEDKIRSTEDFTGKKVGAQMGSSHESFLKEALAHSAHSAHFELISRNKTGDLAQELKSRRIDVAVMEERPAKEYALMDTTLEARLIDSSLVTFAIALKKDSPWIAEINKAIANLRKKGEIERLQKKWLE